MKRLVRIRGCVAGLVLVIACGISPGSAAHLAVAPADPISTPLVDDGPDFRDLTSMHAVHKVEPPTARPVVARAAAVVISPCPAYGTVLIPGSKWLGGRGVDVMSNGGAGATCYGTGPGHRWQCGELINRFLAARRWGPAIPGNAADFYSNANGAFDKHPIGSGYLPVPGDIVVWSGGAGGAFGHVAIVIADGGGRLTVVEQNSTLSGYGSVPIDSTGSISPTGGLTPVGYLHATANANQPPASPSPTPTPAPHSAPAVRHASGGTTAQPSPTSARPTPSASSTPTPTHTSTPTPTPTPTPSSGLGGLLGGG